MLNHLRTLVRKELLSYFRDPLTRAILIGPPLAQLLIFAFAATLTVENIDIAVLDEDGGSEVRRFIERVEAASFVQELRYVATPGAMRAALDRREVIAVLRFAPGFSRDVLDARAGHRSGTDGPATVQVLLDGRRANAAQITLGYLARIAATHGAELVESVTGDAASVPRAVVRHWFNPNLNYRWFIVPSLAGSLAMIIAVLVTALSIARERELGTFDQLLVSPISPVTIIAGKTLPALMIGFLLGSVMVAAGILLFRIPFTGSFALLGLALALFILSVVGIGLTVSSLSSTQQQAILGVFALVVPLILTSGFATPVANMPAWLQTLSIANPLRHFLVIVQGSFVKALPTADVFANLLPLAMIAVVSLTLATRFTASRLG